MRRSQGRCCPILTSTRQPRKHPPGSPALANELQATGDLQEVERRNLRQVLSEQELAELGIVDQSYVLTPREFAKPASLPRSSAAACCNWTENGHQNGIGISTAAGSGLQAATR